MNNFNILALQYKTELFEDVIPFWLTHSQDKEFGGYFTCLDRQGNVFDTDKFIWLQGRQVWLFSMLYNKVEKRKEWLDCAIQGAEFLKEYGHDGNFNWFFSLTREGKPLVEPYNIFSYTFAAMAFGQLSLATGNQEYANIAKHTFDSILSRRDNPKGRWNKAYPGTRPIKGFSLPMILSNFSIVICLFKTWKIPNYIKVIKVPLIICWDKYMACGHFTISTFTGLLAEYPRSTV